VLGLSPEIKAGLAVTKTTLDQGYTLELPDAGADGVLVYAGARLPFVDYLRRVFRWGGFPGWADQDRRPSGQLLTLTDNLSPL
jgi:hypothetical protein